MCGITGYVGSEQAAPILIAGLRKLEYRGYDSAGIAVNDGRKLQIYKSPGRLNILAGMTDNGNGVKGRCGIGHTRWATHGKPNVVNAHPQFNTAKTIAVVHNGIIENYLKLKKDLQKKGYKFISDTDTEVVAMLLDYNYKGDPLSAVIKTVKQFTGSFSLGIVFSDFPDRIFGARKGAPLIVGQDDTGCYLASDVSAIISYTNKVARANDEEVLELRKDGVRFFNFFGKERSVVMVRSEFNASDTEKNGFPHYMLKEIFEQPMAISDTMRGRLGEDSVDLSGCGLDDEFLKKVESIRIMGCGSAYHVGMSLKHVIESIARIPVNVELASEFRYSRPIYGKNELDIVISQSGETADTLAALREAKSAGIPVVAIVNVKDSSIAVEADRVMYTEAGPEIAVATTKAYTAQLICGYLLAVKLGELKGTLDAEKNAEAISELRKLPAQVEKILEQKDDIELIARHYLDATDVFFIGRELDSAISLEGSLKLKEISYIHSEAYAAGELKHGTISLIEKGTPVIAVMTQPELYGKMISNIVEVKSRGASVLAVTREDNREIKKVADRVIFIPDSLDPFMCSLAVVPLQLLAYFVAVGKGCDVDKPRNLAKSVTVE
ncbi:MAG: glutamine--fructose-6-phosphate transaminase (isomerizing) [Oscillospiraceae bacterium]